MSQRKGRGKKLDDTSIEAFKAVVNFINDLKEVFGSKKTPIDLYHRLVQHIKFTDEEAIHKSLSGFQEFFKSYGTDIFSNTLDNIPRGTRIYYKSNGKIDIYIDIQKFIHKGDSETREIIRKHLMAIDTILEPDEKKFEELSKEPEKVELNLDTNTAEGAFISNIFGKARQSVEAGGDMSNPGAALQNLLQSGILTDMITGLNQGMSGGGGMDAGKLMSTMQQALSNLMPKNMVAPSSPMTPPNPPSLILEERVDEVPSIEEKKEESENES